MRSRNTAGGSSTNGCSASPRRYSRRSRFDDRTPVAQPSGHAAENSGSLMWGLPSAIWPLTEAWRGEQQQWPSFTQQAIPHSSAVCAASAMGAETAAISRNSAAQGARSRANRDISAPIICPISYYKSLIDR